jgi:hypothetical protein
MSNDPHDLETLTAGHFLIGTHPRPTPRRRRCSSSRHHQNCQRYRQTGGAQGVSFSGAEDVKTPSNHFGRTLSVGGVRNIQSEEEKGSTPEPRLTHDSSSKPQPRQDITNTPL